MSDVKPENPPIAVSGTDQVTGHVRKVTVNSAAANAKSPGAGSRVDADLVHRHFAGADLATDTETKARYLEI
jgi:hypothetical protein